jgi:hypothetical protein
LLLSMSIFLYFIYINSVFDLIIFSLDLAFVFDTR